MRFEAHPRLLRLLVGSSLYPSADVVIRELVQNAWDAIEWRRTSGDGKGAEIVVRYSEAGAWFEVEDDGIGMTEVEFDDAFLSVGRDKLEALDIAGGAGEQVAFFGIGVLSTFLVAERISVESKSVFASTGFNAQIPGLNDDVVLTPCERHGPGTTVRVFLRPDAELRPSDVPTALSKHVRHVPRIRVVDHDTGQEREPPESWETEGLNAVESVAGSDLLRGGRLGFQRSISAENQVVSNSVTLCNAGFLVESAAMDLLPLQPVGFSGELDAHAGGLTVVMSRERYQRDDKWRLLGEWATSEFQRRALRELAGGLYAPGDDGTDTPEVRLTLIVWWHQTHGVDHLLPELRSTLYTRLWSTSPFGRAAQRSATLQDIVASLPAPRVYVRRISTPTQRNRQIDDEGFPIMVQEEINASVAVAALRARGFPIIEARQHQMTQQLTQISQSFAIDEVSILDDILSPKGIQVLDIASPFAEDLDLTSVERLPILRNVLDVGGLLRFAEIDDSLRRVVSDPSGVRYLNVNNAAIRRLLEVIPAAVTNPLRRRLLEIYLGIEDFRLSDVRELLMVLMEHPRLADMAASEVAPLSSASVQRAISNLVSELDGGGV